MARPAVAKSAVKRERRVRIGITLTIGMMIIITLIFFLHALVEAARDTYTIVGVFHEIPRLRTGTRVHLAGLPVGEVYRVELLLPLGTSPPLFAARLRVPTRVRDQLRHDSRVTLRRHRLMGEGVVDLTPGTIDSPILQEGDTLYAPPPIHPLDLIAASNTLRLAIDSLFIETATLQRRADHLSAEGDRIRRALGGVRAEFERLSKDLRGGPLPDFLADTSWREGLVRIMATVDEIERLVLARARVLGDTPYAPLVESLMEQLAAVRASALDLGRVIEERDGFPARWERDPALRDAIERTRLQLDSLIEVTRRRPWRYFF